MREVEEIRVGVKSGLRGPVLSKWIETGQVAWLPVPEAQPDQLTDVAFVVVAVKLTVHTGWQSPDEVTATVGGQGPVVNERSAPAVWPPAFVPTTR